MNSKDTDKGPYSPESHAHEGPALENAMMAKLILEETAEAGTSVENAEACLKRMLSLKSVVPVTSVAASQAAVNTSPMFREIGTGSMGTVFEHPGTLFVYKLPLTDSPEKLWNNYDIHRRILNSFDSLPYTSQQVEIPRCYWYATDSSGFWDQSIDRFPFTKHFPRQRRDVYCMERIFPLPPPVRTALVDMYCPEKALHRARTSEAERDCLVRVYLGRPLYGNGSMLFSLRNFKLHANRIQELDLDVPEMITSLAHAMAVMHWHTRIDANDVEFVLGSSPTEAQGARGHAAFDNSKGLPCRTSTWEEATHPRRRITSLWLVDFDRCSDISMDQEGVDQAVRVFLKTNHYCPRPNSGDDFIQKCWVDFEDKYIYWGEQVMKHTGCYELRGLPMKFIATLDEKTKKIQG